ncbi:MAG: MBL fold metallo-hydrolase [Synergistaceae bacterium]|nr:MBL fold metallo-hydrolase [Synergistaceae bacterium]
MKYRKLCRNILVLLVVLLSVSFANAQQFRAALLSDISNSSPERFYETKTCTVRSFTNPVNFSCYAHVISSKNGNIVIDPGYYDGDFKEYIKSIGGVDTILLSHCHVDHIIGLDALKKDYPDAKIYIHALDRDGLYDIYANNSFERVLSEPFVIESEALPLEAGDYEFAGFSVKVIPSPGHSPGSSLFYFADEGLLFLGDSVAFRRVPRHDLMNSNVPALFESLMKLKALDVPGDTKIFFGHGEYVSYEYMLENFECFTKTLALSEDFVELEDLYFDGDTLMLPVNDAAKILKTSYFQRDNEAVIYLPNVSRLKVNVGSSDADFDGFKMDMEAPAQIKDGKIYLPGKFIAQVCKNFLTWTLKAK